MNPPKRGHKMAGKSRLLALILVSVSCAYASSGTGSTGIGTISARGDVRVDGYTVWGNGTLFNGTAVETGQATATLRLDNGAEIKLAINSHGVVYRDHLVLLQGRSQLKTARSPYFLEADGLRFALNQPNTLGVVSLGRGNSVDVAAVTGEMRIADDAGIPLAHVSEGAAMSFSLGSQEDAQQAQQPPQGAFVTRVVGLVSVENGNYFILSDEGVKYQLVTGKDLQKFAAKKVIVSGFVQEASTPQGIPELIVASIGINASNGSTGSKGGQGMASSTKILIGTAVAGGAAGVGIAAAESSKSPASR